MSDLKANAVARQIALWDSLLDARIRIQKAVSAANRLPSPAHIPTFIDSPDCRESIDAMLDEASSLSDDLFALQELLLSSNEFITPPPRKKPKTPDLHQATEAASTLEHSLHGHLVQTLSKWSSKIQAVAPSVLMASNRNSFSSKALPKTAVQLIDETLADHAKVLARTQTQRGNITRIGCESEDPLQPDVELFDDTDFYHQLLRDVIDSRGNGDWMATQKQQKVKKNVDTKASKGRKLRYETQEKIQNFMVPVPVPGSWHDSQIDELFVSLLVT